jgi:hypothetical protein
MWLLDKIFMNVNYRDNMLLQTTFNISKVEQGSSILMKVLLIQLTLRREVGAKLVRNHSLQYLKGWVKLV